MNELSLPLLVAFGGAAGAITRYGVGTRLPGPTATLLVNVLGSAAAGALLTADLPDGVVAVTAIGFCGAFTTFSSFAVNVSEAAADGRYGLAAADAAGTLVTALFGVGIGCLFIGL